MMSTPGSEEVLVFAPSYTPRVQGSTPRRTTGGSQSARHSQRQFATNLSPRLGQREYKLSMADDPSMVVHRGDKENRENIVENMMDSKDDREHSVMKIREENAEQIAKHAAQTAKLVASQQALELQLREAEVIHERLRMDLEESSRKAKHKDANEQKLRQEIHQLEEENRLHIAAFDKRESRAQMEREENRQHLIELGKRDNRSQQEREERKEMQERCVSLETQNAELSQQLRILERQEADAKRSRSLSEKERRAELSDKDAKFKTLDQQLRDKDARILELERLMRDKDHHLHEKDCLIHDKDQSMKELDHEQQQRDAAWCVQVRDLQTEVALVEKQASSKRADEKAFQKLKQRVEDQKALIESLQMQLRRTASAASLVAPGEFCRMARSDEAKNGFSMQNDVLLNRNCELESESKLIRKEISLFRRNLPSDVCDGIAREAMALIVADDEAEASSRERARQESQA